MVITNGNRMLFWAMVIFLAVPLMLAVWLVVLAGISLVIPLKQGQWWQWNLALRQVTYAAAAVTFAAVMYKHTGWKRPGFWLAVLAVPAAALSVPAPAMMDIWTWLLSVPAMPLALAAAAWAFDVLPDGWARRLLLLAVFPLLVWKGFGYLAFAASPQAFASLIYYSYLDKVAHLEGWLAMVLALSALLIFNTQRSVTADSPRGLVGPLAYVSAVILTVLLLLQLFLYHVPQGYAYYTLKIAPRGEVSDLVVQYPLPLREGRVLPQFLRRSRFRGGGAKGGQLSVAITPYGRMGTLKVQQLDDPLTIFWDDTFKLRWLAGRDPVPLALQPRFDGDWLHPLGSLEETAMLDYGSSLLVPFFVSFAGEAVDIDYRFELVAGGVAGGGERQIFSQYLPLTQENGFSISDEGWYLLPANEEVMIVDKGR